MVNDFFPIENLVRGYYSTLKTISGGNDGWYGVYNGSKFRRVIDGFVTDIDIDTGLSDEAMADYLRSLSIDLRTFDLSPAFHVFGYLVTKNYEGKPIAFVAPNRECDEAIKHITSLEEIPTIYDKKSYRSLRGTLSEIKKINVDYKVKFSNIYVLELPQGEGPRLMSDEESKASTNPTSYRILQRLVGVEQRIIEYAKTIDEAIARAR